MISAILLTSALSVSSESIVNVFRKTKEMEVRFLSDTMKFRHERESFHESEFLPAVENMLSLLEKGQCSPCLIEYLNALTLETESADETVHEQLAKIIKLFPKQLNKACSDLSKESRDMLHNHFDAAFDILIFQKSKNRSFEKKIPGCFKR